MGTLKFHTYVLSNGMRILIYPQDTIHSVSVLAMLRAGHLSEDVTINGISHLTEHMLFDGTKKFPTYKSLTNFFNTTSGELTAHTSFEPISVGGTFVDEEIEQAFSALEQIVFQPLLKENFLIKEKSIILDELATYEDSPDYLNFLDSKRIRFTGNTILSKPLGGTMESIHKITIKDVVGFHSTFFVPNNMSLLVVGNNNIKKVLSLIKKYFGTYKNKKVKHMQYSYHQYSKQKIYTRNKKSKKSYIRITFPSYSWKSPIKKRIGLSYLCDFLANRRDSYLFSKLREELGWIYDISADFIVGFDIGTFELATSTPIHKSLPVIKEVLKTFSKAKMKLIENDYFELIKDIDRKRLKMVLDTPQGVVKWFSEELFYRYPKILLPKDIMSYYNTISPQDLSDIAQEIFNPSRMNISILQPFGKNEKNRYKEEIQKYIHNYG